MDEGKFQQAWSQPLLQTAEKFSHCKDISTPEKELWPDHSISDLFEITIPAHYNKYFTENSFLYPQCPKYVCWKSLDLHMTSTKHQTFSAGLSDKDVHREVHFHLEPCMLQLPYRSHWQITLFACSTVHPQITERKGIFSKWKKLHSVGKGRCLKPFYRWLQKW